MLPFPSEVLPAVKPVLQHILILWLIQPLIFYYAIIGRPFFYRLVAFLFYLASLHVLALHLRDALGSYYTFNVNLLWWPYALHTVKYIQGLFDPMMEQFIGLSTFSRCVAFCYSPATLIFSENAVNVNRVPPSKVFLRGALQVACLMGIAFCILTYQEFVQEKFPRHLANIMIFYQVALSMGGVADMAFNAPAQLLAPPNAAVIMVANVPALTIHPRYLWARWSSSAGFHLRRSVYEPLGGRSNQWFATCMVFGFNCLLHIFWWGPISANKIAWDYFWVLFFGPLVSLAADKYILKTLPPTQSDIAGLLLFFVLIATLTPKFVDAQGMPTSLIDIARLNLGEFD